MSEKRKTAVPRKMQRRLACRESVPTIALLSLTQVFKVDGSRKDPC